MDDKSLVCIRVQTIVGERSCNMRVVPLQDHENAMRAAKLLREGLSKIIKEQERLLTYVYKYFPARILLSDGWMEDCKEILAIDSQSDAASDPPTYTALHYVGIGPLPNCDACGHSAQMHSPPNYGRCPAAVTPGTSP